MASWLDNAASNVRWMLRSRISARARRSVSTTAGAWRYLGSLPGLRWGVYLLMGFAFALIVAGNARPSPASIAPGRAEAEGVLRVTRHPLWCLRR